MVAQTQKAAIYEQAGEKPVLGERPVPTPAPNQVLVKVVSAGVNSVDWKLIKYRIFIEEFPSAIGKDIAGIVEKVGDEVKDFKVGDRVIYQSNYESADHGGFQQYSVQDATLVSKIPDNVDFDSAATVPLASLTALVGLFSPPGIPQAGTNSTKSILILGGASNVGQFAIQLARIAGIENINTTASPKNKELCLKLGATHFFDRSDEGAASKIKGIIGEDLRYAFDAISSEDTQRIAMEALADNHKLASGQLVTPQVEVVGGLEKTNEALERLEAGDLSALKLIIKPQE
ncbi:Type I Polyketide synthase [Rhizina undulata]